MIRSAAMARCSSVSDDLVGGGVQLVFVDGPRAGLKARMSYRKLGMTQPPLTVTAWLGAWGGLKRVLGRTISAGLRPPV